MLRSLISNHDGRRHGGPGHGRGQAGNSGGEGPQVEKEVSFTEQRSDPDNIRSNTWPQSDTAVHRQ